MAKTYLEFGSLFKNKKKKYEALKDNKIINLYDTYMFSRYFNDIYVLKNKKKLSELSSQLHDIKDLKFSFVIYILILTYKIKKYYEFGSTIFERYFFLSFFEKKFSKKTNLKRYYGNDISDFFIYFSNNIFNKFFDCLAVKKFNKKLVSNSIFFSKGISLLYEKQNKKILKEILFSSKCGFFDFSILKNGQVKYLNTGKNLYFLGYKDFFNIVEKFNKKFFYFRKIKKKKDKVYFECMYGEKDILNKFLQTSNKLKINNKEKKYLDLNFKFTNFQNFKKVVMRML